MEKRIIEYLEKPATKTEKEAARFLENLARAFCEKDPGLLDSLIDEKANISMFNSRALNNKRIYLRKSKKIFEKIRAISYTNVLIRSEDDDRINIYCVSQLFYRKRVFPQCAQRHFVLEKRNGRWLLVEARG